MNSCGAVDAGQEGLDLVEGNVRCFPEQGRVDPGQLHAALGLAPARTIFPSQRRNCSSPARLGAIIATMASVPQS
jgi:hypothetical protein